MYIIGIDEVGRGALAGPVVVAVVALPRHFKSLLRSRAHKIKLRDSKKLSPKSRELWFEYVKERSLILYDVSRVYPKKIDSINISKAANLAATRALARLLATRKLANRDMKIFLDSGLYLNTQTLMASGYRLNPKTFIKGDEKINAIKLASIVAKVTRDRYMIKLHEFYPRYGFDTHKGYGTKSHIKAIRKHGYSDVHRKSFKVKHKII